jgi:hypothetical protein
MRDGDHGRPCCKRFADAHAEGLEAFGGAEHEARAAVKVGEPLALDARIARETREARACSAWNVRAEVEVSSRGVGTSLTGVLGDSLR